MKSSYKISSLKRFSEFRVADISARNITFFSSSVNRLHSIARNKLRKMYLFGYVKALYDLDKKKHKKSIRRLLDWCDTLDIELVRLDLPNLIKESEHERRKF